MRLGVYFVHTLPAILILMSKLKKNTACLNHKYRFLWPQRVPRKEHSRNQL